MTKERPRELKKVRKKKRNREGTKGLQIKADNLSILQFWEYIFFALQSINSNSLLKISWHPWIEGSICLNMRLFLLIHIAQHCKIMISTKKFWLILALKDSRFWRGGRLWFTWRSSIRLQVWEANLIFRQIAPRLEIAKEDFKREFAALLLRAKRRYSPFINQWIASLA